MGVLIEKKRSHSLLFFSSWLRFSRLHQKPGKNQLHAYLNNSKAVGMIQYDFHLMLIIKEVARHNSVCSSK